MAEEKPGLQGIHIDSDWKKQAQEEKRKLAEAEEKRRAEAAKSPTAPAGLGIGGTPETVGAPGTGASRGARGQREMPPASFATLVQSVVTQVLFYLGDLSMRGAEPTINLDMAKHHIDTLSMLEEKTKGNLSEEEKRFLDAALYEARMRYVSVAQQFIS